VSSPEAFATIKSLRGDIDQSIANFLNGSTGYIRSIGVELAPVADAMSSFLLDGGKRFRPLLSCIGSIAAAGAQPSKEIVTASSCLELLHACALIHDDVMDGSDTRRGNPAIHKLFEELHRKSSLSGDSQRYGVASAILLGDLALIWADQMLHTAGLKPERLLGSLAIYDELRVELMAGQYLDVHEQALATTDAQRSLKVASYKSGKYSIERPLHFGAKLAGGDGQILPALSSFGIPIGEAFQLRDDLLGVFGNPAETGKPAGDDLREGKATVLIALTFEGTSESGKKELSRLGKADLQGAEIAKLQEVIISSGAVVKVEEMIRQRAQVAESALTSPLIAAEAKPLLQTMAEMALVRSS
jgi:geranylgeranyl diphosphate synthase type I